MRRGTAVLLLLAGGAAWAQDSGRAEELLAEGNAFYEAGDFTSAATAYRRILDYGVRTAIVHYNLGNALFKAGDLGGAILNYERAVRQDPRDVEARENLDYAQSLIVDQVAGPEPSFPARVLSWALARTTPREDALLLLIATWLLGTVSAAAILIPGGATRRRALAYVGAVLLCLALFSGGSLVWKDLARRSGERGVILADKVDVLSGPSQENTPLFTVHEGLTVRMRAHRDGWVQILLPNGLNGWVPERTLEGV